jgi:hypothetical protein
MMISSHGPLDEKILKTIEQFLKFKFPKGYREFLLKFNGGEPEKDIFDLGEGGLCDVNYLLGFIPDEYENILVCYRAFRSRIPKNTFPIGRDSCGNLILISVKMADRGKIYFWDHEMECGEGNTPDYSNMTLIADSFDEFFNNLKSEDDIPGFKEKVESLIKLHTPQ